MSTSHLCNGKWKPGPVAECSKHTRLSKKQSSVYRRADRGDASSGSGGDSSASGSKTESGSKSVGGSKSDSG